MAHEIKTSIKQHMDEFNSFRAKYPRDQDGNLTYLDEGSPDMDEHDRLSAGDLANLTGYVI